MPGRKYLVPSQTGAPDSSTRFAPLEHAGSSFAGVELVDELLDRLSDLTAGLRSWSPQAWALLDEAADSGEDNRDQCRAIGQTCADASGRGRLVRYATGALLSEVPAVATVAARQAVADAVLAMLLADLLPILTYAVLTRPVNIAVGPWR